MTNITYLGPEGATFSAIAYDKLAALFGAPPAVEGAVSLAASNDEVIPLLVKNGGYGAIAMETKAEGRVDSPVNSFIELLRKFSKECPLQIVGALRMKIHFALMAQSGIALGSVKTVLAHPKAVGVCRERLKKLGAKVVEVPSNGQAAERAAGAAFSEKLAALAPLKAAQKYSLNVLANSFEDTEAVTTFFLLGPHGPKLVSPVPDTRALAVFRLPHQAGALVKALTPFAEESINLRLVHSLHWSNGVYDFAIESENAPDQLDAHLRAIEKSHAQMERWIQFGPFPVISE